MGDSETYRINLEGDSSSLVDAAKEAKAAMTALGSVSNMVMQGMAQGAGQFIAGKLVDALTSIPMKIRESLKAFQDLTGKLADMSARTGIAASSLQALAQAGKPVGVSMGQIVSSVEMLKRRLDSSPKAFEKFGLSVAELKNMAPDQAFMRVAQAVREVENPMLRSAAAIQLFGRAGSSMLPLITSDMEKTMARARELGIVLDEVSIAAGDSLGDAIQLLDDTMEGFWNNLVAGIAKTPALHVALVQLQDVFGSLSQWVKGNQQVLSDWVTYGIMVVVEAISASIDVWRYLVDANFVLRTSLLEVNKAFAMMAQGVVDAMAYINNLIVNSPNIARVMGFNPEVAKQSKAFLDGMVKDAAKAVNDIDKELAAADKSWASWTKQIDASAKAVDKARLALIAAKPVIGSGIGKGGGEGGGLDSGLSAKAIALIAKAKEDAGSYLETISSFQKKEIEGIDETIQALKVKQLLLQAIANSGNYTKDFGGDKQKKDLSEVVKLSEKIGKTIREQWSDGLNAASDILAGIDDQLAQMASAALGIGADIMSGNWLGALTKGVGLALSIFKSGEEKAKAAAAAAYKKKEDLWKQKADALNAAKEAEDQIKELQKQADAFRSQQLGEGFTGLTAMYAAVGKGATMSQERMDRMGRMGIAMFSALRKQGVSYVDAVEQMGPALDAAAAAAAASGLSMGGGFAQLSQFRALVTANKELVASAEGWGQAMEALRTTGSLDLTTFNDQMLEANSQFKDLTAAGFTEAQALSMLAPGLLQLQKSAAAHGYTLDANTQALIDQAQASGAFEGLVDPMDELVEISNKMLACFILIAETMGAKLTPEMQKWKDAAAAAAKEVAAIPIPGMPAPGSPTGPPAGYGPPSGGSGSSGQYGPPGGSGQYGQYGPPSGTPTPLPTFAQGSGGFLDFGEGTPVILHGREAVVPENITSALGGVGGGGPDGGVMGFEININVSANGTDANEIARQIRQQAAPELIRALRVAL
jgi:hypothetical protein